MVMVGAALCGGTSTGLVIVVVVVTGTIRRCLRYR